MANIGKTGWRSVVAFRPAFYIPPHVLADRDRRLNMNPRDLSIVPLGDPLPGYSAADRTPSIVPAVHRDPLDALIFRRRPKTGARYG